MAIGRTGGRIACLMRRNRRKIAHGEIRLLLADELTGREVSRAVNRGFQLEFTALLETFCFPCISAENIGKWIRLHGVENLEASLCEERGALIILLHFGPNQMVMPALGHRGYQINQLGSRPDDWNRISGIAPTRIQKRIFDLRLILEKHLPANFIYIDKTMKPIYDSLKSNGILIMAADGRAGSRFVKAKVLNRIMNLSAGPFRIAHRMNSPIVPMFPVRLDDGMIQLEIETALNVSPEPDADRWIESAAGQFGAVAGRKLQSHPDHYCMLMTEARLRADIDPVPLFEDYRHEPADL